MWRPSFVRSPLALALLALTLIEVPLAADTWNPFAKEEEAAAGDPVPENPVWPRWQGWPAFTPMPDGSPSEPGFLQQWSASTQVALRRTRDALTAPFDAMGDRLKRFSARSDRPETTEKSGWTNWWQAEEPPPERPTSVNEFLALPRPE